MGRIFLEIPHGEKLFACAKCSTPLASKDHLNATRFTGNTGRAFLFTKASNVKYGNIMDSTMMTGRHKVRYAYCIVCSEKLGWQYEYAHEHDQKYKEGKVILERVLIKELKGFDEDTPTYIPSEATPPENNAPETNSNEMEGQEAGEIADEYSSEDQYQRDSEQNSDDGNLDDLDEELYGELFPENVGVGRRF